MFERHKSADQNRRPLQRGRRTSETRRGSVVDWINGLTDNNQREENEWDRVDSAAERRTRHGSVVSVEELAPDESTQHKAELIAKLKREVKMIMEEAVTKRQVDLNSPYVTSLCSAVENCLMDGLRRRLLGLFGSRSSLALLHTVAKTNAAAELVLAKTLEINEQTGSAHHLIWIREALHMRTLSQIVHHIASAKSLRRLFDNSALMLDRAKGGMVAALLCETY
uniref:RUN domain-containing protein n=1 Tax=Heterorhabditis bacteriophora TaxID=37862 RepID=A0A1I7XS91_HETBA